MIHATRRHATTENAMTVPATCPKCAYANTAAKAYCMKCGMIWAQAEVSNAPLTSARKLYGIDDRPESPETIERVGGYSPAFFVGLLIVGAAFLVVGGWLASGFLGFGKSIIDRNMGAPVSRGNLKLMLAMCAAVLASLGVGVGVIRYAVRYRRTQGDALPSHDEA